MEPCGRDFGGGDRTCVKCGSSQAGLVDWVARMFRLRRTFFMTLVIVKFVFLRIRFVVVFS